MKNRVGIYFTTRYCQTRKIANYIAQWLREYRTEVEVIDLAHAKKEPLDPLEFDAVLVGAPVYQRTYPRELRRFVRKNRETLAHVPCTGFFSVCLAATPPTPEAYAESLEPVRKFLDEVAWSPQWIASFPGALNFVEYNPLLRWIMRNISAKEGGPTDTSKDFYLTRWEEVSQFAGDFYSDNRSSRYRAETVPRATHTLNIFLPEFEQRIVQQIEVVAKPAEVAAALETMELEDMPLAGLLAWMRNLGRVSPKYSPHVLFEDAAEAFGALTFESTQPHEFVGALIGQFWRRDYGIRRLRNVNEFRNFAGADYAKTLTNFWFDETHEGKSIVRTETRIHATSRVAERKFRLYWLVVSLGVRLYMRSVLHGIRRSLRRRRWERRAVAA